MSYESHATGDTETSFELTDEDLELVVGGKEMLVPRSGPASTMICSGSRGLSTHTELSLEL